MCAATKVENRTGKEAEVRIGENTELEHGDAHGLCCAAQSDFFACDGSCIHQQGVLGSHCGHALIGARLDRTDRGSRIAIGVQRLRCDGVTAGTVALQVLNSLQRGGRAGDGIDLTDARGIVLREQIAEVRGHLLHTRFRAVKRADLIIAGPGELDVRVQQGTETHEQGRHQQEQKDGGNESNPGVGTNALRSHSQVQAHCRLLLEIVIHVRHAAQANLADKVVSGVKGPVALTN